VNNNPADLSDAARTVSQANLAPSDSQSTKEILDHMARLDFNVKPEGGTFVSFHFEYNDYLDEIGCIDPVEAKQQS